LVKEKTVYFAFDESSIKTDLLSALDENSARETEVSPYATV
jgi:hypothetical protein